MLRIGSRLIDFLVVCKHFMHVHEIDDEMWLIRKKMLSASSLHDALK